MPPKPENKGFHITMTPEEKAAVDELAKEKGFKSTADYIRSLVEIDAERAGKPIKFTLQWGGHRGKAKKRDDLLDDPAGHS